MFTPEQKKELNADLMSRHVKSRSQSGRALSYIEGWHAIAEANRIFGFGFWDRKTISLNMVAQVERKVGKTNPKDGWGVSYTARVRVTVRSSEGLAAAVVREGVGAGHGIDVDLGLAHESAIKEAETDAMKRALMTFGNPFGLALYDKEQASVSDIDLARLAEFEEGLAEVSDTDQLQELIDEYTPDVLELRTKRRADWQMLNTKVQARKRELALQEKDPS